MKSLVLFLCLLIPISLGAESKKKVRDYTVVCDKDTSIVSNKVGDLINNGWELYGNPALGGYYYCQAMVKY